MRGLIRTISVVAALVIVPIAFGALFAVMSGWRVHNVVTNSMEPTLAVGSIVITKPVSASSVAKGDIISFTTPAGTSVIHRVVDVAENDRGPVFVTRGDANDGNDHDTVDALRLRGRLVSTIPSGGGALPLLFGPTARVLYVLVPLALLALQSLVARRPTRQRLWIGT